MHNLAFHARNVRGQALIQALVAVGIVGILAVAMMSLISTQSKEMSAVNEKLGTLDLQRQLITVLAGGSVCRYQLTQPTPRIIDTTLIGTATPPSISMSEILSAASPTATAVASVGSSPATNAPHLVVTQIALKNITAVGVPDLYSADIVVDFAQDRLVRPLRSLSFRVSLTTTGPPNAKAITGCSSDGGTAGPLVDISCYSGTTPSCIPSACPIGWNDLGVSSYVTAAEGAQSYYKVTRGCSSTSASAAYETSCQGYVGAPCTPSTCPLGWTDIALSSYVSALSGAVIYVRFYRTCVK
jgi:type II secretory pathway pseudopilin PulG